MTEATQPKPTYEQLEATLQGQQMATQVAIQQRDAANNQVVELSVAVQRATQAINALQAQVQALTPVPPNRAARRAKK